MSEKAKKAKRPVLRFNEHEIKLILSIIKNMEKPLELMYYFLEKDSKKSFVMMLVSADDIKLHKILNKGKRSTDLMFSIDEDENLFAVICQETKVDGAYRFAERILKTLISKNANNIYCTEIEVRTTKYEVKDLITKAIEKYMIAKKEKRAGEILFYTL